MITYLSTVWTVLNIALYYGIIWFERFGSDKPRTLINQLFASVCWSGMFWMFLVQIPFVIRDHIHKSFYANFQTCSKLLYLNVPHFDTQIFDYHNFDSFASILKRTDIFELLNCLCLKNQSFDRIELWKVDIKIDSMFW